MKSFTRSRLFQAALSIALGAALNGHATAATKHKPVIETHHPVRCISGMSHVEAKRQASIETYIKLHYTVAGRK